VEVMASIVKFFSCLSEIGAVGRGVAGPPS